MQAAVRLDERRLVTGYLTQIPVAFQGEPGSFSSEAALAHFKSRAYLYPCSTFVAVCEAVVTGKCKYGVLPIANSQTGRMYDIEQLICYNSLAIQGMIDYPINHCFLCLPGQKLSDIVIVVSHPQALAQCSRYLESLNVQIIANGNTAASAKMIREKQLKGFAAVGSMSAAKYYALEVLAYAIHNTQNNTTRFVIVQRELQRDF